MQTKICCSSFLIFLLSWASLPSYAQNRVHQLARDIYYWSGDLSKHEQTNVALWYFATTYWLSTRIFRGRLKNHYGHKSHHSQTGPFCLQHSPSCRSHLGKQC